MNTTIDWFIAILVLADVLYGLQFAWPRLNGKKRNLAVFPWGRSIMVPDTAPTWDERLIQAVIFISVVFMIYDSMLGRPWPVMLALQLPLLLLVLTCELVTYRRMTKFRKQFDDLESEIYQSGSGTSFERPDWGKMTVVISNEPLEGEQLSDDELRVRRRIALRFVEVVYRGRFPD